MAESVNSFLSSSDNNVESPQQYPYPFHQLGQQKPSVIEDSQKFLDTTLKNLKKRVNKVRNSVKEDVLNIPKNIVKDVQKIKLANNIAKKMKNVQNSIKEDVLNIQNSTKIEIR